jgi:hypothetical protein
MMLRRASILAAAGVAVAITTAFTYLAATHHRSGAARASASPAPSHLASARSSEALRSLPEGLSIPPVMVPSTVTSHGSFASTRGARFYVFDGLLRPGALGTSSAGGSASLRCVTAVGSDFSGVGCGRDPLRNSNVFFFEGSEGGPTSETQTEHYISGLISPRVARVEAVDSAGGVEQAQVNRFGAFFVELPTTALETGVRFETLRVYDANGELIQQADA